MEDKKITIGIIGGGFSGTVLASNLISNASKPLEIILVEESYHLLNKGIAYSTTCPYHPLNIPASQMGASPDDAEDFYRWILKNQKKWRSLKPYFSTLEVNSHSFLPRLLFGMYMEDLFQQIQCMAKEKGVVLRLIFQKAVDVHHHTDQLEVVFQDDSRILVDKLVLATGVSPFKKFPFEDAVLLRDKRYVSNFWGSKLTKEQAGNTVVIIGSGLTMIDAVASLKELNYSGKIVCISLHGKIPAAHLNENLVPLPFTIPDNLSTRLIIKYIRNEIKKSRDKNWRQFIDSLRPKTEFLWKKMPLQTKKRFLRHFFSFWNKFRHRMSPESYKMIEQLKASGHFFVCAGRIEKIDSSDSRGLKVHYETKGEKSHEILTADCVINCSGPDYSVSRQKADLIANLIKKGMIEPDPLGWGLTTSPRGDIQGNIQNKIYAIGALFFGERFETTAVPEIRSQAALLARLLLY